MYVYSVHYKYAIGGKPAQPPGGTVLHAFTHDRLIAQGASNQEILDLASAIQARPNGYEVLAFVNVTREEWVNADCPPRPEEYGKEVITDLGKGHDLRIEPAIYDGQQWRSGFTGKRLVPERWLLKTPIIEDGIIVEPA